MRVDVEKFLVVGPSAYRDRFFSMIQGLGVMEFISPAPLPLERPHEIETILEALHILKKRVPVKQAVPLFHYREALALASHIVETNEMIEKEREKIGALEKEVIRIEPFGDFSLEEVKRLESETRFKFQFFVTRGGKREDFLQEDGLFFICSKYHMDYFVSISETAAKYPGFIEMKITRSLFELKEELANSRRLIDMWEGELASLAKQERFLKQGLISALNRHNLSLAKEKMGVNVEEERLFTATGWVPKNKLSFLEVVSNELPIHFEPIKQEKEDSVPTYLENKGLIQSGEDLIDIYDTPSTKDLDPSAWVLFAFGLFFSMIVADAGYGLLILAMTLFLWYKNKEKAGFTKRILRLSLFLSVGCILWGILSASFFAISFSPDSHLRDLSIIDWITREKVSYYLIHKPAAYDAIIRQYPNLVSIHDPTKFLMGAVGKDGGYPLYDSLSRSVLLELAIFIGVVHTALGFLRYLKKNWSGYGWVLFLIGGYLYIPSVINTITMANYLFHIPVAIGTHVGLYLLFIGASLAFFLAILQKRLHGLEEITRVLPIFADVMSYLRIYAIALSGVMLGETFNTIAADKPYIISIFILLVGHSITFTMAMASGIIHGLRLNFIEWYHYSFEGGGRKFKPLALYELD